MNPNAIQELRVKLNTATKAQLEACADLRDLIDDVRCPEMGRRMVERVAGKHALSCAPCKQIRATHRIGCACTGSGLCEHEQWRTAQAARLQREFPDEPEPRPIVDLHLPEPGQGAAT